MITVKYKGEVIDIKDIEITWQEETYREWWGDGQPRTKTGTIEDYGQSKYSEGRDDGYEDGYDACASTETGNEGW